MTLRMPGVPYIGPPDSNWGGTVSRPPMGMVCHTAVGSYDGTIAWQKNPVSDVSSYFVTAQDGRYGQMLDLDLKAWTQGDGNTAWIGVENEGDQFTPWTDSQLNAMAQIFAFIKRTWSSVPYQVTNSPSVPGLGWHGMGGVAWGNHPDCPGAVNVALLPVILQRAMAINGAGPSPTPSPLEENMHFAREPNGSVWWVGIGYDPANGRPYRRGLTDPAQWGRWQAAGFPTTQLNEPMVSSDWSTLPSTGPTVAATAVVSDAQAKAIADAAATGAAGAIDGAVIRTTP